MKIKFLGTAAAEGVPALFCKCEKCRYAREVGGREIRTRCQTLINGKLMIDFGPDTYHHAITNGIDLSDIHDYLITHAHQDHICVDEVWMLGDWFVNLPKDFPPFNFYAGAESIKNISDTVKNIGPRAVTHTLEPFKTYDIADMKVTPLKANHTTETPFIYIIESDGKRMLYAHDTGLFPEETEDYLYTHKPHFDLITFDCCCGTWEDRDDYGGHMALKQNRMIAERMRKEGMIDDSTKLVANHFSHNSSEILYKDRAVYEKAGFIMSYDSLEIEF